MLSTQSSGTRHRAEMLPLEGRLMLAADVVINEIMFHAQDPANHALEDLNRDWIEIYNRGDVPANLTGWKFTKGVIHTFSSGTLDAGAYLVVASNLAGFSSQYPGVTNVVGPWIGSLSNSGEEIKLEDQTGATIDSVTYADEGEWAIRDKGLGTSAAVSLTSIGTTATLRFTQRTYYPGDTIVISGADQPEYNGQFTVGSMTADTLSFKVSGTPVSPATGNILIRQVTNIHHSGWSWLQPADGLGSSLELINPALTNNEGQNWQSSTIIGGTPGAANSVTSADIAPIITNVNQSAVVPKSSDVVTITAKLVDESAGGLSASLFWRKDAASPPAFTQVEMKDDGTDGDAIAGDGTWSAIIPAQTNLSVVEFYISASDGTNTRTYPAANTVGQTTNLLYQVDNTVVSTAPGAQPFYRIIMTEKERAELQAIDTGGDSYSNATMNGTFISQDGVSDEIRYTIGIRNRGHSSRIGPPNNYRVNIPNDRDWKGQNSLNFNNRIIQSELIGPAVYKIAGMAVPNAVPAQLRVNGVNPQGNGGGRWGTYALLEEPDSGFAKNHLPDDPNGNLYAVFRSDVPPLPSYDEGDFKYEGTNPTAYRDNYLKQTNSDEDDYSDIIHMTDVLANSPAANYAQDVNQVINLDQWLHYFALDSLMLNRESGLSNGMGDDYYMYRGLVDTRFKLVPHDLDTLFNQGDTTASVNTSIFQIIDGNPAYPSNGVDGLRYFFSQPGILQRYYQAFIDEINTVFNPTVLNPLIDHVLGGIADAGTIAAMKKFVVDRTAGVLAQIPQQYITASTLTQLDNYYRTTNNQAALTGTVDASKAESVLINGLPPTTYNARTGAWSIGTSTGGATVVNVVKSGDVWKYKDDGSDQGTTWRAPAFDDSSWAGGPSQLGYGDGDEATTVGYGPDINNKYITTYFRRTFIIADANVIASLSAQVIRDDGIEVYINGTQVSGIPSNITNMPATYDYTTDATISAADEATWLSFSIDPALLVTGANTIAVEIHQNQGNDPDISFDMKLDATFKTSVQLVPISSNWKYLNDGSDQGTTWHATVFDDSLWPTAQAEFGLQVEGNPPTGEGDEKTLIHNQVTTYFRKTFVVGDKSLISGLTMKFKRDDGLLVYLNGVLIPMTYGAPVGGVLSQTNMPTGAITSTTPAASTISDPSLENAYITITVDPTMLVNGTNTIACELHQGPNSIDLSFDLALDAAIVTSNVVVTNGVPLIGGVNRVTVQAFDGPNGTGNEVNRSFLDIWYDTPGTNLFGQTLATNTEWTVANSPYHIIGDVIVPNGVTLKIDPGVSVFFDNGVGLTINSGGRLLAEGTDLQRLRFTHVPNSGGNWNGVQFANTLTDNRITYSVLEWAAPANSNGLIGTTNSHLTLDHDYFDHADHRRIRTQGSALTVTNSFFTDIFPGAQAPTTDNLSEDIWGDGCIDAIGGMDIENNIFGPSKGHNDILDINPCFHPHPIGIIRNNIFLGNGDDGTDLEGDALIEGNFFSNIGRDQYNLGAGNSNPTSLAAGANYYLVRNTYYNDQYMAEIKDNAFATFQNNTFIAGVKTGTTGVLYFIRPQNTSAYGKGVFLDGDIFSGATTIFEPPGPLTTISANHSILNPIDLAKGVGNLTGNPGLTNPAGGDYSLKPGSIAIGAGPNGIDMGSQVGKWEVFTGVPFPTTDLTTATITVYGPAITAYKYSLDGGPYSAEKSIATPITLSGLSAGSHTVSVLGKNFAEEWQPQAQPSITRTWTVDPAKPTVHINEVLALNTAIAHAGSFPDLIELANHGASIVDLSGMSITDTQNSPRKYVFPAGTTIAPGQFFTLYADNKSSAGEIHLGFSLRGQGEGVYLYNSLTGGGAELDGVTFGQQIENYSIGRKADGSWALNQPTFGSANILAHTGDVRTLKINEWQADGITPFADDFVELYNPDPLPVSLAGLYLTGHPESNKTQDQIAPLSFIPGGGLASFTADGNQTAGAEHLNFKLDYRFGHLALYNTSATLIDQIIYFGQRTGISEGRSPNGASAFAFFTQPNPGITNPGAVTSNVPLRITEINYNPPGGGTNLSPDDYEFVEIKNIGASAIQMQGVQLAGGINFTFPTMSLAAGAITVVVKNPTAFVSRYGSGINIAGTFTDTLSDSGEVIRLLDSTSAAILDFAYSNSWYPSTDGGGATLQIVDQNLPATSWGLSTSWRPSKFDLGSPGTDESTAAVDSVVINELLTNSNLNPDWIELSNTTAAPIDISGWYLSDSAANLFKFHLPAGSIIPAHGFLTLTENNDFGNAANPNTSVPFSFSQFGDETVYLSSSAGAGTLSGYRASQNLPSADEGVTLGRFTNSINDTDFVQLSSATFGAANAYPKLGPVEINEVMYHPAGVGEFIEIKNVSNQPQPLYDPSHPANAWAFTTGVDFVFPPGTILGVDERALIVSMAPAQFRTLFSIPASVQIFGPYTGALDNNGDTLSLSKPGQPDPQAGAVPFILVDNINYTDAAPWPVAADGNGPSLSRISNTIYGNEPLNWNEGPVGGTPGQPNPTEPTELVVDGTAGADSFYVRLSPGGGDVDIFVNIAPGPNPTLSYAVGAYGLVTIHGLAGNDNLTIDLSNGNPIPVDGLIYDGGTQAGAPGDSLTVVGSGGAATYAPSGILPGTGTFTVGGRAIYFSGLEPLSASSFSSLTVVTPSAATSANFDTPTAGKIRFTGLAGATAFESLTFVGSSLNLDSSLSTGGLALSAAGSAIVNLTSGSIFGSIALSTSAKAIVSPNGNVALSTSALSISGFAQLDLNDNDLIVTATPATRNAVLAAVAALVASGRNTGASPWTGPGIISSAAAANPNNLTGLATILNDNGFGAALYPSLDGKAVNADATLVKYTWNGDTDTNGIIDADDYFHIDSGFVAKSTGYRNGDFDFNGSVDADDYFLIDRAFVGQTGVLTKHPPAPMATIISSHTVRHRPTLHHRRR